MGADIPDESPELPLSVAYLWELHKSIRFSVIQNDDHYSLMPREPLSISEVDCYLDKAGLDLSKQELDVILALDAIYEKYRG